MVDTKTESVEHLADTCKVLGDRAHARVGHGDYMRALWKSEDTLRELVAQRNTLIETLKPFTLFYIEGVDPVEREEEFPELVKAVKAARQILRDINHE